MKMVWAGITYERSSLDVKISEADYYESILKSALKPSAHKHFGHRQWTFQHDSVLFHHRFETIV